MPDKVTKQDSQHKRNMQEQKQRVDAKIAAANEERGLALLLTGNGKGKTSSALGMAIRALGYGQRVGIVQFIKGAQDCGEVLFLQKHLREQDKALVNLYQMGTGFTWNTQDKIADIVAAERTWAVAAEMLKDTSYDLVILDELTYMLGYKYLDRNKIVTAITERPREQSVVVTGRGGGRELRAIMDTISDVKSVKHAFNAGLKARKGVDF